MTPATLAAASRERRDIVSGAVMDEKRLIRFVGNGNPQAGGKLFITCTGD